MSVYQDVSMYRNYLSFFTFFLLFVTSIAWANQKPIHINFWHSMSGELGEVVQEIVNDFNHSQSNYTVDAIYKGEYVETLTTTVAAFRAHQQPDMVQIFEVGAACLIFPSGIITPVSTVLHRAGIDNLEQALIPTVKEYYSDKAGKLLAMPFNCSTAVMYYNKDAFKRAGLDPDKPPRTWPQLANMSRSLVKLGFQCGFTTAWPSWIQLESFCAWHNIPYANQDNGFKSVNTEMIFNHPLVIQHITALKDWQKQHIFCYGGRNDDAQALFTSEKAAILFESSGSRPGLTANTKFSLGIATLPFWPVNSQLPQNATIGGGAIWVMSGKNDAVYNGIAHFFAFLLSPSVQMKWQSKTGYIPLTNDVIRKLRDTHYYEQHPETAVAIQAIENKPANVYSRGIRLGGYTLIREMNDIALEQAWSNKKSPKQALDDAVQKGNRILRRFRDNVTVKPS